MGGKAEESIYDLIVIGAGPAGSSAAIYGARAGLGTLVIDKGLTAGALGLSGKISNYPGVIGPIPGAELVRTMRRQAESFGARFLSAKAQGVRLGVSPREVITDTGSFRARALILATGAMARAQTLPGESRLMGRGVSYCVTCDGPFCRNQKVAVVGNNDETVEEALRLTSFADRVYLICPTPVLRASPAPVEEAAGHSKIEVRLGTAVKEIVGGGQVEGVLLQARGSEELLPVQAIFVYLQGNQPVTDYLLGQLEVTPGGCLVVDWEMGTNIPGVFAAGDLLCSRLRQAVVAAAEGATAAMAAERFLRGGEKFHTDWR